MKRILLALTLVGLLLPFAPRAQAETEVSLNLFYDNLYDQGTSIRVLGARTPLVAPWSCHSTR